jgi:predicted transcriptional regulator
VSFNKKPFRRSVRRPKSQTTEEKIKDFVIRNSKNGYYTKVSTLSYKFEISQERAWEIVGELLDEGSVESVHDERSGEMKLCETGKTYLIMDLELKRKRQKSKEFNKSKKQPGK